MTSGQGHHPCSPPDSDVVSREVEPGEVWAAFAWSTSSFSDFAAFSTGGREEGAGCQCGPHSQCPKQCSPLSPQPAFLPVTCNGPSALVMGLNLLASGWDVALGSLLSWELLGPIHSEEELLAPLAQVHKPPWQLTCYQQVICLFRQESSQCVRAFALSLGHSCAAHWSRIPLGA